MGIAIALCTIVLLAVLLFKFAFLAQNHNLNYDVYMSIMLTSLGVIIGTFAVVLALAAIWGYAGLKDNLREMAVKQVNAAMQDALKQYPAAADMFKALNEMREQKELIDRMRNRAVTVNEPKSVEIASKPVVQEGVDETPLESIEKQATPIARLPGEEDSHGDSSS